MLVDCPTVLDSLLETKHTLFEPLAVPGFWMIYAGELKWQRVTFRVDRSAPLEYLALAITVR